MDSLIQHSRLAYDSDEAEHLLGGIGKPKLGELVRTYRLRTFRVGRKHMIPSFEVDRLISELMRVEQMKNVTEGKNYAPT